MEACSRPSAAVLATSQAPPVRPRRRRRRRRRAPPGRRRGRGGALPVWPPRWRPRRRGPLGRAPPPEWPALPGEGVEEVRQAEIARGGEAPVCTTVRGALRTTRSLNAQPRPGMAECRPKRPLARDGRVAVNSSPSIVAVTVVPSQRSARAYVAPTSTAPSSCQSTRTAPNCRRPSGSRRSERPPLGSSWSVRWPDSPCLPRGRTRRRRRAGRCTQRRSRAATGSPASAATAPSSLRGRTVSRSRRWPSPPRRGARCRTTCSNAPGPRTRR